MIRDGVAGYGKIAAELGVHKSSVQRIGVKVKGGGGKTEDGERSPTYCSGKLNCRCVWHKAEAWKAARREAGKNTPFPQTKMDGDDEVC